MPQNSLNITFLMYRYCNTLSGIRDGKIEILDRKLLFSPRKRLKWRIHFIPGYIMIDFVDRGYVVIVVVYSVCLGEVKISPVNKI